MANKSFMDTYKSDMFAGWHRVAKFRKPLIAAVNGYDLFIYLFDIKLNIIQQ